MNMDYLKEFVVLSKIGNFMSAADELYISQSSLSKHIKSIEKEINALLFDRTTRSVTLTEFGKCYLEYAEKILAIHESYIPRLQDFIKNKTNSLTIASLPVMAQYGITEKIAKFKKLYNTENLTINISEHDSSELPVILRQHKCDFAFIRDPDKGDDIESIKYADDTMVIIVPPSHKLSKEKKVELSRLKDENFIFLEVGTVIHNLCINACHDAGFEPKIIYTGHRLENLIDLVSKEGGICMIMKKIVRYYHFKSVVEIDVTPVISSQISLCYLKTTKLSPIALRFIDFISENIQPVK